MVEFWKALNWWERTVLIASLVLIIDGALRQIDPAYAIPFHRWVNGSGIGPHGT